MVKSCVVFLIVAVLALAGCFVYLHYADYREVWYRESPLVNPVTVSSVDGGKLTLADGRAIKPAGIQIRSGVLPEQYEEALRAATKEGVVILRDLGDGSALFMAEPVFYNWCGTRNHLGRPNWRWAGSHLQVTLSEFRVYAGYAEVNPAATGLTFRERWRLDGAKQLALLMDGATISPMTISKAGHWRYDSFATHFSNYKELDDAIEANWQAPPE